MNYLKRITFNLWYYQSPPWDTGISPPELIAHLDGHPAGRALDLGCGTGTNAITMAKRGWKVTGVDFAWRAIRIARKKAKNQNLTVDFRVEDVTQLNRLNQQYDLILDMGCFHSLSAKGKIAYAHQLPRLLAPHATYMMYGFFKESNQSGSGLLREDLDLLSTQLELVRRQEGTERGQRPSAWFTYRHQ